MAKSHYDFIEGVMVVDSATSTQGLSGIDYLS